MPDREKMGEWATFALPSHWDMEVNSAKHIYNHVNVQLIKSDMLHGILNIVIVLVD